MRTSLTASIERRGFTLIEMSIVITLVALFAVFILPNLVTSRQAEDERLFVDGLKRLADNARDTAISKNETLHLSLDGNRLTVTQETDTNQKGDEVAGLDLISGAQANKFQANGQDMESGDWDLRFYPDGTADEGGVEIDIRDATYALNVTSRGAATVDDQLTDYANVRWDAGTYETR